MCPDCTARQDASLALCCSLLNARLTDWNWKTQYQEETKIWKSSSPVITWQTGVPPTYWSPSLQFFLVDLAKYLNCLQAGFSSLPSLNSHWRLFDICYVCELYCMQCLLLEVCICLAKVIPPLCSLPEMERLLQNYTPSRILKTDVLCHLLLSCEV